MSSPFHDVPGRREVFDSLVVALNNGRWHDAAALYAADVSVTNPFDGQGPKGWQAVEQFFTFLAGQVDTLRVEDILTHDTADPEVLVAEMRLVGTSTAGGGIVMPAVFVLRVRDGVIVESRDYIGPQQATTD